MLLSGHMLHHSIDSQWEDDDGVPRFFSFFLNCPCVIYPIEELMSKYKRQKNVQYLKTVFFLITHFW